MPAPLLATAPTVVAQGGVQFLEPLVGDVGEGVGLVFVAQVLPPHEGEGCSLADVAVAGVRGASAASDEAELGAAVRAGERVEQRLPLAVLAEFLEVDLHPPAGSLSRLAHVCSCRVVVALGWTEADAVRRWASAVGSGTCSTRRDMGAGESR